MKLSSRLCVFFRNRKWHNLRVDKQLKALMLLQQVLLYHSGIIEQNLRE